MKPYVKALIPLFVFLALSLTFFIRLTDGKDTHTLPSQLIDHKFPVFSLPSLYEPEASLDNSIFEDKIVLVNVFGSWCVACRQEHGFLQKLSNSGEIPIIGVDWRDDRDKAKAWLAKGGNPYAHIIFDHESALIIDLGVTGAPESFLVDQNGRIRYKYTGPLSVDIWERKIRPVIKHLEAGL